jgi:maltose alpha-D-glucosyltransferase/alpha-amylase
VDALWFKNAVFYAVDVAMFRDGNGDGVGDLTGLLQGLDYLRGLGVTALWLHPFYPSPRRDRGYDVSDYYGVSPSYGDLADFRAIVDAARSLGLKVLLDLVVQHTSDEHPWFCEARSSRDSRYRDFYVWIDDPSAEPSMEPMFPGRQESTWSPDERTGQYYRHRFYSFEPDLNIANPRVRDQIFRIMRFWLGLGASGFRIDAAPYLVQDAARVDGREAGHWLLEEMRQFVTSLDPEAVLLGETDLEPPAYADYFGHGNRLGMQFNFYLNNFTWLSLAQQDAAPIVRALKALPRAPAAGQYAVWLRNHDELDLGRLTDAERAQVFEAFAPEPDMQIFGRGARRRLAPMLGGADGLNAMAHALLFSLPGAPVIRYGEEIGMGEDLSLEGRAAVTTPMQWSSHAPNAGFSDARSDQLVRQVLLEGPFGAAAGVSVEAQSARPGSLLDEIARLIRVRRQCPEIGTASWSIVEIGAPSVLGLRYQDGDAVLIALVNLAEKDVTVGPEVLARLGELRDVLADRSGYEGVDPDRTLLLNPRGYRWIRGRCRPR